MKLDSNNKQGFVKLRESLVPDLQILVFSFQLPISHFMIQSTINSFYSEYHLYFMIPIYYALFYCKHKYFLKYFFSCHTTCFLSKRLDPSEGDSLKVSLELYHQDITRELINAGTDINKVSTYSNG